MPLVRHLIRGTDFRHFVDFVSPAFFDVMPAGGLVRTATRLARDYSDKAAHAEIVRLRRQSLTAFVDVADDSEAPPQKWSHSDEEARRAIGQAVLQIYFHQLFDGSTPSLLNLGAERFRIAHGRVAWTPGRGHFEWPAEFRSALVEVYRAFYAEGGGSLALALAPLRLEPVADIFAEHFGGGDQRAVTFRVSKFIESFHAVFMGCKAHGVRLDPAFLSLGIYLATMYETLETVGVPLDVRSAFEAVHGHRAAA